MKKVHFSLLVIVATVGVVLAAGCLSPNQSNVAPINVTENTTTSTSSTTSNAISRTAAVSPSPSPSATVPSASPTSTPAPSSTKIPISISANSFFYSDNTITKGSPKTTWAFEVTAQGKLLCGIPLTATIDGRQTGTLTSQAGPDCFTTANYALSAQDTNGLSVGPHTLTIHFAGDGTYQPATQDFQIEVA